MCVSDFSFVKKRELRRGRGSAQTEGMRGIGGRPAARSPISCREERHGQQGRTTFDSSTKKHI